MSRLLILNSDTIVQHQAQPQTTPPKSAGQALKTWGDYFDYYVIEEYKGDSVAGYLGHKLTGAAFVFGSVFASPLLATGCTAEMDQVQPFIKTNKGDTEPTQDAVTGSDAAPDTTPLNDANDTISQPDDGMTLIDAEQDGATDAGLDAVADSSTDADTAADDADAMSVPDDGMTPIDAKEDGTTDAGLDAIADSSTDTDASTDTTLDDADGMSVPDDGMTPIDAKEDTAANETSPLNDASAEVDACTGKPTCTAGPGSVVKKDNGGNEYIEASAKPGEPVAVTFMMSGSNYICNIPNSGSIELPGQATPVTVYFSADKTTKLDNSCEVFACGSPDLTQACPPIVVNINNAPVINKLKTPQGTGILPSGDQCFSVTNALQFTWDASDADNDPLNCTVNVTESSSGKTAATVSVTQAAGAAMLADIPANSLKARTDYCWNLSCSDGKASAVVAGGNACFTTSEKGLIGWWRFDEGQGDVVKDASGNGIPDGKLTDFDLSVAWVKTPTGTGIFFDGVKNYINIPTPASWNNLNTLSAVVVFSNAFPLDQNAVLIDKMGDVPTNRWTFEFMPSKAVLFGTCAPTVKCELNNIVQSKTSLADSNWHTLTGIYTGNSSSLYVDNVLEGQIVYSTPGPLVTTNNLLFGKWTSGGRHYHGIIDEARFYVTDTSTQCK